MLTIMPPWEWFKCKLGAIQNYFVAVILDYLVIFQYIYAKTKQQTEENKIVRLGFPHQYTEPKVGLHGYFSKANFDIA